MSRLQITAADLLRPTRELKMIELSFITDEDGKPGVVFVKSKPSAKDAIALSSFENVEDEHERFEAMVPLFSKMLCDAEGNRLFADEEDLGDLPMEFFEEVLEKLTDVLDIGGDDQGNA